MMKAKKLLLIITGCVILFSCTSAPESAEASTKDGIVGTQFENLQTLKDSWHSIFFLTDKECFVARVGSNNYVYGDMCKYTLTGNKISIKFKESGVSQDYVLYDNVIAQKDANGNIFQMYKLVK